MPFITTRFRGHCSACNCVIEAGENAFYANKKLICAGCSDIVDAAKKADGPVAATLKYRGTAIEIVRQLRSSAQRLASNLNAAAKEAEALALGLQQIEDQQTEKK